LQLGIFMDLRNPHLQRRDWADHYRQAVELVVGAEQAGIDAVWMSEHHLFEDGYLPQPLTFAAGLATRTSRMRIGTAVTIAPLRHPRHLAEEAAVVDLLSGGRLELGVGAGYVQVEYDAFGVDIDRRYGSTDGVVREVQRLLAEGLVTPAPLQDPLPIWLGYQGPKGARRAGRLGVGLLSLSRDSLAPYREGLAEGGHDPASARMGGVLNVIVADDPEQARQRILPYYAHQSATYRQAHGMDVTLDGTIEQMRKKLADTGSLPGLAVLDADSAIAEIRSKTEGLPVEHVYLWASVGGMDDDLVERHLDLVATRVRPALQTGAV
jgi:alkanesulfonate monooxygenase SsuD/methylene tetrahydromethanopterin reductase-like flavin-dependent oxidoreductase (luciferase family)